MEFKDLIGFAAVVTTVAGFLPKAIKMYKKGSADEFPWYLVAIFFLDVVLWFAYGYMIKSAPTMLVSALVGIIVIEIAWFKKRNS